MESNESAPEFDPGLFDFAASLAQIGGEVELLDALVAAHLEQEPLLLRQFDAVVLARDPVGIRKAAHALASAVSVLCATRARTAAKNVEALALRGDLSRIEEASRELRLEFQLLKRALASPDFRRAA